MYSIKTYFILDQFNNLDNIIFVDWSINVDSVVYSVVVNNVVTKTVDGDVELSMDSTSTNFQLSESDTRKSCGFSNEIYYIYIGVKYDFPVIYIH